MNIRPIGSILILFSFLLLATVTSLGQVPTRVQNGGGKIEIKADGSINITPKSGQTVNLNGVIQSDGEVRAQNYASIANAVTAIGSANKSLVVTSALTVSGATTIPANVSLILRGDGQVTATAPVTIEGQIDAPLKQIFFLSGSGSIKFKPGKTQRVFPEWWGAVGNATGVSGVGTDCTTALNQMISSLPAYGGVDVYLLGRYRVTNSINILNRNASAGLPLANLRFYGNNAGSEATDYPSSALVYDGASTTTPLVNLHSYNCRFVGIAFLVASGRTCIAGVDIDRASGSISNVPTDIAARYNNFEDCIWMAKYTGADPPGSEPLSPTISGTMTNGVRIGAGGNSQNNDFMRWQNCKFSGVLKGIYIAQTDGQSTHNTIDWCSFDRVDYAVYAETGAWESSNTGTYSVAQCAYHVGLSFYPIHIINPNAENTRKLYEEVSTAVAASNLLITGGRIALDFNNGAIAEPFVSYFRGGVVEIRGVKFEGLTDPQSNFHLQVYGLSSSQPSTLISEGNSFPTLNPYHLSSSEANYSRAHVVSRANVYNNFAGVGSVPIKDFDGWVNTTVVNPFFFSRIGIESNALSGPGTLTVLILGGGQPPEGNATAVAPPGSFYLYSGEDGGTPAMYFKQSGNGNTGWVAK